MDDEPRFVVVWVTGRGVLAQEPPGGIPREGAEEAAERFDLLRPEVHQWVEPWEPGRPPQSILPHSYSSRTS